MGTNGGVAQGAVDVPLLGGSAPGPVEPARHTDHPAICCGGRDVAGNTLRVVSEDYWLEADRLCSTAERKAVGDSGERCRPWSRRRTLLADASVRSRPLWRLGVLGR